MNCQDSLVSLMDALASDGALLVDDAELNEHLASCPECALAAKHYERQARALAGLDRQAAPSDLAGRVVAALQSGFRQERALRCVVELETIAAPPELDKLVSRALVRQPAPDVLERLVREDFENHDGSHFAKRFTHKLGREHAPEKLAERLESHWYEAPRRRPLLVRAGLVAAGMVATFALWRAFEATPGESRYSFGVNYVSSFQEADLDAGTRQIVDVLSAGALGGSAR